MYRDITQDLFFTVYPDLCHNTDILNYLPSSNWHIIFSIAQESWPNNGNACIVVALLSAYFQYCLVEDSSAQSCKDP